MEEAGGSQIDLRVRKLHKFVQEEDLAGIENMLNEGSAEHIVNAMLNGNTSLHVAARVGNAEVVDVLLRLGRADIHLRNNEKDTPLHLAACFGHDVVERLLELGTVSDLLLERLDGDRPLHPAAMSGKQEIIRQLLSAAANREACISAKNDNLRTPLHYAAGSGNLKAVELLLDATKENPTLKYQIDSFGALPFHFAAFSGDVVSMQKLAPQHVNVECNNGLTALHFAAWNGKAEAVKYLLQKGATFEGSTCTPLHLAATSPKPGRESVVETIVTRFPDSWMMENEKGELAIGLGHERNYGDVVRAVLRALQKWTPLLDGDDALSPTHSTLDATLLLYAAAHGTKKDIEWLSGVLEEGETVDSIIDEFQRTPLHWAAMKDNTSTLKALSYLGADLINVDATRRTPLFLAFEGEHMHFAEGLLKCDKEKFKKAGSTGRPLSTDDWMRGVDRWFEVYYNDMLDIRLRNQLLEGSSGVPNVYKEIPPVYLALHAGKLDIAKFFQRLSEDAVNMKGPYTGRTALHWAVLFRRQDIVEQLINNQPFSQKVRVYEKDASGKAPVEYATEMNLQDIESMLVNKDAGKDYLYRDRQIYVDSTNAILVGAALIASVTFAGWLQPPLGFTDDHYDTMLPYVAIRQVPGMRVFWIFNSLSFFAAIGSVQTAACGVFPVRHEHIGHAVNYIRRALMVASLLMALSVVCVLVAFGAAGFIVLPPRFKFEFYMIITVVLGGLLNAGLILWFLQRILLPPRLFWLWRRHRLLRMAAGHPALPPSLPPSQSTTF